MAKKRATIKTIKSEIRSLTKLANEFLKDKTDGTEEYKKQLAKVKRRYGKGRRKGEIGTGLYRGKRSRESLQRQKYELNKLLKLSAGTKEKVKYKPSVYKAYKSFINNDITRNIYGKMSIDEYVNMVETYGKVGSDLMEFYTYSAVQSLYVDYNDKEDNLYNVLIYVMNNKEKYEELYGEDYIFTQENAMKEVKKIMELSKKDRKSLESIFGKI